MVPDGERNRGGQVRESQRTAKAEQKLNKDKLPEGYFNGAVFKVRQGLKRCAGEVSPP